MIREVQSELLMTRLALPILILMLMPEVFAFVGLELQAEPTRDELTIMALNVFGTIAPFLVPIVVGLGEVASSVLRRKRGAATSKH